MTCKRKATIFLSAILLLIGLSSCTTVRSVSITQIPKTRTNAIKAEVSKFVFLAFNFDNDYVDQLTTKLREKCQGGKVEGILTKHEHTSYLLFTDTTIQAKGYCNKPSRKRGKK